MAPGRKKWIPTPEILARIKELAAQGITEASIAYQVGCHPSTFSLRKQEYPELNDTIKEGRASGEEIVVSKLWELIHSGHATAILFYLKCQHNWNDRPNQDNSTTNIFVDSDAKNKVRDILARKIKEKEAA